MSDSRKILKSLNVDASEARNRLVVVKKKSNILKSFFEAIKSNNHQTVCEIISDGVNVNFIGKAGETALFMAANEGHVEIVKLLLAAGANVNLCSYSLYEKNPLFYAAANGHVEVVKILLAAGADIYGVECNIFDRTVMYAAAENNHQEIMEIFLAAIDNSEIAQKHKIGALYAATQYRHSGIVKILIEAGTNVNIRHKYMSHPLFVAASNGDSTTVELLLAAGANANMTSVVDVTPLRVAVDMNHAKVVKLLLAAGAEVDRIIYRQTELEVAVERDRFDIIEMLLRAGAKIGDILDECSAVKGNKIIGIIRIIKRDKIIEFVALKTNPLSYLFDTPRDIIDYMVTPMVLDERGSLEDLSSRMS